MAYWKVSTQDKKSVEEHELWHKDGREIRRVTGFRWGTWTVETEGIAPPEFVLVKTPGGDGDADSINMYNNGYETELESMDDGWYEDVQYPADMDKAEQERMAQLWDESYYDGWEGEGWSQTKTEAWVWGAIDIEKIEE
jgi:hypothetical protein